ncbi:hypothetical protein D3C72_1203420 [compost metagenome]
MTWSFLPSRKDSATCLIRSTLVSIFFTKIFVDVLFHPSVVKNFQVVFVTFVTQQDINTIRQHVVEIDIITECYEQVKCVATFMQDNTSDLFISITITGYEETFGDV